MAPNENLGFYLELVYYVHIHKSPHILNNQTIKKKSLPKSNDSDPWIRTPKYARFVGDNVMIAQ